MLREGFLVEVAFEPRPQWATKHIRGRENRSSKALFYEQSLRQGLGARGFLKEVSLGSTSWGTREQDRKGKSQARLWSQVKLSLNWSLGALKQKLHQKVVCP